jgi:hypothetical protein
MAKAEKRLERIRRSRRSVRFEDLRTVLEWAGFSGHPGKGDHWVFAYPDFPGRLSIDPRKPFVLKVYVDEAIAAIDLVLGKQRGGE